MINPHADIVHALTVGLQSLYDRLDADPGDANLDAACTALERMLRDAERDAERWESDSARRAAETRLQYHDADDTLDLY
jgi:hypothetical protein